MPNLDRTTGSDPLPSAWVRRFAPSIRPGGSVLDLACGRGRHTRELLALGFGVTAVDIDVSGLERLRGAENLEILELDLETGGWPLAHRRFAGIVVTNYLHRPHFPWLVEALDDGGVLIFETFGKGNERFGRPRNPDFLLAPGELLRAFGDRLQIVAYEHGVETLPRPAVRQRLCAVKAREPLSLPRDEPP